ncbi:MarR family transcriptional regulator [Methylocucumis oryzae]|uniref:HTH marR-type domain-containing protein n=1 Tax=Methylocucumis oryzae TaxID=1632867 RepID=A0A0F3IMB4_9GAMM|nr:MarR family transcriptional regulator [Methylocucumis oryzae]KJV06679.1 hypothetical protein VZ94_09760 [Methylocucumis oryzae]
MDALNEHRDAYRNALKDQNTPQVYAEKAWLTAFAAQALLNQDNAEMRAMLASYADLAGLADHFDTTGKPGDRWRTINELLTLALESGKPLQQLRLVMPSTVSGSIMSHIDNTPGITPSEIARRCSKEKSHIANELKKLEQNGLCYRLKQGRKHQLFLSKLGKDTLDSIKPVKLITTTPKREFEHANPERSEKI